MAQRIVIVDYGSSDLSALEKVVQRAAREAGAAAAVAGTDRLDAIAAADRLILPGAGPFGAGMARLADRAGVLEAMEHAVLVGGRAFLGVCGGMRLLATRGGELGSRDGLGWIAGNVEATEPGDASAGKRRRGWSALRPKSAHPLLGGLADEKVYFEYASRFVPENDAHVLAVAEIEGEIAAAVARDNIAGVQFHPEKSGRAGLALLSNFLAWTPG